jgi:hypothetical protein
MKKLIFIIALIIFTAFVGKNLLPSNTMFTFHDVSQPARIQEFSYDLTNGQIPPRIAPHMSFGMGYPVFNFYAPFSYWVSSVIHLSGFDIADSIKIAFLVGLLTALVSMYYFLRLFFKPFPSVFGAVLFSASPYLAMEIFARGNLGEIWFLALMPATLYFFYRNSQTYKPWIFIFAAVVGSFSLTAHNVLSLVFLPILLVYIFFLKHRQRNYFTLFLSFLLASYFLIPAVLESAFTNASQIASLTNYNDNFLCWWQLWTTNIFGYGASNPGCTADGISFMLGKVQVIFGVLGLMILLFNVIQKDKIKQRSLYILFALVLIVSAFMSTYSSQAVWKVIPFIAVFQFPWRFLIFTLFGLSFFSAYFFSAVKISWLKIVMIVCLFFVVCLQSRYFYKPPISKTDFLNLLTSPKVIHDSIAYRVSEYLPTNGDYNYWRDIEFNKPEQEKILNQTKSFVYPLDSSDVSVIQNTTFTKKAFTNSQNFLINIHYLPYWQIKIDNKLYIPTKFDPLARPIIKLEGTNGKIISLSYQQTQIEMIANYFTLLGIIGVALFAYFWRKQSKHSHTI